MSSTCTAWTLLNRDPSIQYKAPPDMDKFNLYSLDLMVLELSVQYKGPPDMEKFNLYSVDLVVQDPSMTCSNL